ncbi:MAG: hypothetical protein Fur0022_16550 [Anaerolineales bacterium]
MHVQDGLVTMYINSIRLSNVVITKLNEGRIGFWGNQESGETSCVFEDNWIWVLGE